MSRPLFIAGATGKQGGATIRALLAHPSYNAEQYPIYAMTRDPSSTSAQKLQAKSSAIKLVKGDLLDAVEAFKNLPVKPWGLYFMTAMTKGKAEDQMGKEFIDEAIKAGAKHIVFSSVERGSANGGFNATNVPHFTTKHNIESHLMEKTKGTDISYTILRPVFFLDNLEWGFIGKVVSTTWRDYVTRKLQVIDTEDIGKVAANGLLEPDSVEYKNKAISLAGDELTFKEANDIFKKKTGNDIPVTFGIFATLLTWLSHDMGQMFKFFNDPGYDADIKHVNKLAPVLTFEQWIEKSSFAKKTA